MAMVPMTTSRVSPPTVHVVLKTWISSAAAGLQAHAAAPVAYAVPPTHSADQVVNLDVLRKTARVETRTTTTHVPLAAVAPKTANAVRVTDSVAMGASLGSATAETAALFTLTRLFGRVPAKH